MKHKPLASEVDYQDIAENNSISDSPRNQDEKKEPPLDIESAKRKLQKRGVDRVTIIDEYT
ncbi:MAG: hypothetical protein HQL32_05555 [Planctomycetes bacterium]|nr:hypothetical protein [Planctomycetota bacterium]